MATESSAVTGRTAGELEVSVIIPTYNRVRIVSMALERLFAQVDVDANWEILVVDDGSTDGTADAIEAMKAPCDLRVARQPNRGVGAARNHGADQARGRVLLYLDDDILADPGLVAAHVRAHRRLPSVVCIGQIPLLVRGRPDPFARYWARHWAEHYDRVATHAEQIEFPDCFGGNLSIERDAFIRIGGFATDLPRYNDIEFGFRVSQAGQPLVYLPDAIGRQFHTKSARQYLADMEKAGEVGLILYRRHPSILGNILLGSYTAIHIRERVVRSFLLSLGAPTGLVWLLDPIVSRTRLARIWYRGLVRYFYWRGVKRALRDPEMWRRLTSGVVILVYHAFGRDEDPPSRFVVKRQAFVRQLAWLRRRGYHTLSLQELVATRRENRLPPARSVVVTIDDAYKDAITIAQPVLRQFRVPATVFAVTGRVGGAVDWTREGDLFGRALADWDDLRRLSAEGTAIGAHSRTHPCLTTLSATALDDEVSGARADLERELGRPASVFAYPGGRFNESVLAAVERAGFEAAVTTMARPNGPFERDLTLGRLTVYGTDSLLRFALALHLGDASWLGRLRIRRGKPPEQSAVVRPSPEPR